MSSVLFIVIIAAPIPRPAPNIARPIVPAVVQLVPVTTENIQQDIKDHK